MSRRPMMHVPLYSVWNGRSYDYYAGPTWVGEPPAAKHLQTAPRTEIGIAPEHAAWRLPTEARRVGAGVKAKGMIVSVGSGALGLGGLDFGANWVVVLGLFAAAVGLMHVMKDKRHA